jgi:hypothetical protein
VAAAIMGNASIAARSEKEHLIFKGVRGERPAVTENDRLSLAPVVVIDLRAVFGRDRAHGSLRWLGSAENESFRNACVTRVSGKFDVFQTMKEQLRL